MLDVVEQAEKVTAPAKLWRNWWLVLAPISLRVRGVPYGDRDPGEYMSAETWPTKERAEEVAVSAARKNPVTFANLDYIGAFPEGEHP